MVGLMDQGLELAMLGMGTVFVFLTLLVAATMLMSRIVMAMEVAPAAEVKATEVDDMGAVETDKRLIAVISAAVARFRADKE